ncbi:MAG: DUF3817 domain-containing protein [Sulfurimonas sp.]|nr:DUF3817 domain-containing protein [Sulfurimonas sp.]
MINESVRKFGLINTIEGYSYIILVFIAMPMKYLMDIPLAVKIAGMAHGVLFIIFLYLGVKAWISTKWSLYQTIIFFIASLLPFGTFFTKSKIKAYE